MRTERNFEQVLGLALGAPTRTRATSGAAGSRKRDTSYFDWIERRKSDTTERDRELAALRRSARLDAKGLTTESRRFVATSEELKRF